MTRPASTIGEKTTLQKHVGYFDLNSDGVLWPIHTFKRVRALDFGLIVAILFTVLVHTAFSYPSLPRPTYTPKTSIFYIIISIPLYILSLVPDPFFRVYIKNIKWDVHGSDSRAFDPDGNFVDVNFERIFEEHSTAPNKDSLSLWETLVMLWNLHSANDHFGPIASLASWLVAWYLLAPQDGRIPKAHLRTIYDGSGFHSIAKQVALGGKRGRVDPTLKP